MCLGRTGIKAQQGINNQHKRRRLSLGNIMPQADDRVGLFNGIFGVARASSRLLDLGAVPPGFAFSKSLNVGHIVQRDRLIPHNLKQHGAQAGVTDDLFGGKQGPKNMAVLPKGRVLKIEMEIVIHGNVSEEDAVEYLEAELSQSGGYSLDNALSIAGFEVLAFDCEDTGAFVSFAISDVRREGASTKYSVSKYKAFDRRTASEIEGWETQEDARAKAFADVA